MSALSLIQAGDPAALAAVLNRSLNSQGVQVKARRRESGLYLLFEAASPLPLSRTVAFVRAGLRLLEVHSIQQVTVYGRRRGDRTPAWRKTIALDPSAIASDLAIDPPEPELPDILKRPEAVAFILFCSLVLFWDAYLAAIEQDPPAQLTSGQLAHRLKTSRSVIRSMRHRDYFSEWTSSHDPDKVAWRYQRGWYVPKC
jgi:hypothetical protein